MTYAVDALADPAPPVAAGPAATGSSNLLRRVVRRALGTTSSGTHRTLTDLDKDELEALVKVIEAKRSPLDRWITRGLIPVMLLVAGPIVTYYFTTRVDQAAGVVQSTNDEVSRLTSTTDRLEKLVAHAGARIEEMDDSRAQELHALRVVVQRLENALRMAVLQTAIRDAATAHLARAYPKMRGAGGAGGGPDSASAPSVANVLRKDRDAIIRQVQDQTQQQFPGTDAADNRAEIEEAYDRYLQQQVQVQKKD